MRAPGAVIVCPGVIRGLVCFVRFSFVGFVYLTLSWVLQVWFFSSSVP